MTSIERRRGRPNLAPVAAVLCVSVACARRPDPPAARPVEVSADSMGALVGALAADSLGGRNAGYPGEEAAARLIASRFQAFGLEPGRPGGGYVDTFSVVLRQPVEPWETRLSRNVVGFLPGTDSALRREIVVLGAHYDGQGRSGQADPGRFKAPAGNRDSVWNSADDNASGTAAVLEIARVLAAGGRAHRRSIMFVAFGAEEPALGGSIGYVNRPPRPWSDHVAMINIEKIGREPKLPLIQATGGSGTTWKPLLDRLLVRGRRVESAIDDLIFDTDHYPFAARGVPAVVFAVIHETDTHLPADEASRIDPPEMASRTEYILAYLLEIVNGADRPGWIDQRGLDPGAQVGPPTSAELRARGLDPATRALKVLSVIDSLPAAVAGLVPGDLIVAANGGRQRLPMDTKNPLRDLALATKGPALELDVVRPAGRIPVSIALPRGKDGGSVR
jgi:hypothetical protein